MVFKYIFITSVKSVVLHASTKSKQIGAMNSIQNLVGQNKT